MVNTQQQNKNKNLKLSRQGQQQQNQANPSGGQTSQSSKLKASSSGTSSAKEPAAQGNGSSSANKSALQKPDAHQDAASTSGAKRPNASMQAYRMRRKAHRILAELSGTPASELSDRDRASLKWAKENVSIRPQDIPQEQQCQKRQLSPGTPPAHPTANNSKRPKLATAKPASKSAPNPTARAFSDVAKDSLVWAIIDRSNGDGTISPANWKLVESALRGVYKDIIRAHPGPSPVCRDFGWHQGHVKLIACADQRSADLYKLAIELVGEVWPGAKLEAVTRDQIPNRPRSKAWVPLDPSTPEEILELLQLSNSELPAHDWKVAKLGEPTGNLREALIVLNEESLAPLEASKGIVNYGFGSITLRIYNCDKSTKTPVQQAEEQVTDEPTAMEVQTEVSDACSTASTTELLGGLSLDLGNIAELSENEPMSDEDLNRTVIADNDKDGSD